MAKIPNRRKYTALTIAKYKGIDNAWLAPDGKLYSSGYMGHNEWASDYIFDKIAKKDENKHYELAYKNGYAYEYLHKLGWYRLLTWSGSMTRLLSEGKSTLTNDQKDTLMFWCSANGRDYDCLINHGYVK